MNTWIAPRASIQARLATVELELEEAKVKARESAAELGVLRARLRELEAARRDAEAECDEVTPDKVRPRLPHGWHLIHMLVTLWQTCKLHILK